MAIFPLPIQLESCTVLIRYLSRGRGPDGPSLNQGTALLLIGALGSAKGRFISHRPL